MVTIIGGGIAGSALAGALARRGDRQVTLFEQQRPGPRGAFLFVDGRGHEALHHLGVDQEVLDAASFPVHALHYADSRGRGASMSRGHRFWLRAALMEILDDFVARSGAELRYGSAVTDIALAEGTPVVRFGDETVPLADDHVIGADGIDSVVRAHLEPHRVPEYAGDVVLYGRATVAMELDSDPQVLHFFAEVAENGAPGATFGHIWRADDHPMWFIRLPREPLRDTDDLGMRPVDEWADAVRAATPSIPNLTNTLLSHTDRVHVSNARTVPLESAATPDPRVVLIGDADHAITPAAGVGARDALEDAAAVFDALTAGESPANAMAQRRIRILEDRARALRARANR
ncbi:FAD-dependent oxidoreductase [Nocardia sp. NPDC003482]